MARQRLGMGVEWIDQDAGSFLDAVKGCDFVFYTALPHRGLVGFVDGTGNAHCHMADDCSDLVRGIQKAGIPAYHGRIQPNTDDPAQCTMLFELFARPVINQPEEMIKSVHDWREVVLTLPHAQNFYWGSGGFFGFYTEQAREGTPPRRFLCSTHTVYLSLADAVQGVPNLSVAPADADWYKDASRMLGIDA